MEVVLDKSARNVVNNSWKLVGTLANVQAAQMYDDLTMQVLISCQKLHQAIKDY